MRIRPPANVPPGPYPAGTPDGLGNRRCSELILCAGLKSSGSTWLYNAVIQLCRRAPRRDDRGGARRVLSFYAETLEAFPPSADRARLLIVKTHIPSSDLVLLAKLLDGYIFITVREPRDAIASLMQRFDHRFEGCLKEVAASASRLAQIASTGRPLVLKYEEGFCSKRETLGKIARKLGLQPSDTITKGIFQALTPARVQRKIDTLAARGAFGRRPNPDRFDPATHWHPGHIGDRRVGKYPELLSPAMQRQVLEATAAYCTRFGYPPEVSRPVVRRRGQPDRQRVASAPSME